MSPLPSGVRCDPMTISSHWSINMHRLPCDKKHVTTGAMQRNSTSSALLLKTSTFLPGMPLHTC